MARASRTTLNTMTLLPSKHSVAGHDGTLTGPGIFCKKTVPQEFEFYAKVAELDGEVDSLGDALSDWMPRYYGELTENTIDGDTDEVISNIQTESVKFSSLELPANVRSTGKKYLVLSNLYDQFKNPSILDIKLGSVLTDEFATAEKVERLRKVSQSTTSSSLGCRICGMKVYGDDVPANATLVKDGEDSYVQYDKNYGKSLTKDTFVDAIKLFFNINNPEIRLHYIKQFWKRLQLLYNCLLNYEIRIISGSLLFIYENHKPSLDVPDLEEADPLILEPLEDDEEVQLQLSSLHLIDFAHAKFVPGKGPDDNILTGIESLIAVFEGLVSDL